MGILYLFLLLLGLAGFTLHLIAQWRVANLLRKRYPQQWDIVVAAEEKHRGPLRTWGRLQRVLHSDIPEMFDDPQLTRWHRIWRHGPWLAWPSWLGALALRMWLAH